MEKFHKILVTNWIDSQKLEPTAIYNISEVYTFELSKNITTTVQVFDDRMAVDVFRGNRLIKSFELDIDASFSRFAEWVLPMQVKRSLHHTDWIDNCLLGKQYRDVIESSRLLED